MSDIWLFGLAHLTLVSLCRKGNSFFDLWLVEELAVCYIYAVHEILLLKFINTNDVNLQTDQQPCVQVALSLTTSEGNSSAAV